LSIFGHVVAPREKEPKEPRTPKPPADPKVQAGPSRPDVIEVDNGPDAPPITSEKVPNTEHFKLLLNRESRLLSEAKALRRPEEEVAVAFVFKYGLALTVMGLLDAIKKTPEWIKDEAACRKHIEESAAGIARVIVPLCLSLPNKLPKAVSAKGGA